MKAAAGMADLDQAAAVLQPGGLGLPGQAGAGVLRLAAIGRLQGVAAEAIEQVHQQQLLVLLLVLQAQLHQLQLGGALIQLIQLSQHGPIHLRPPGQYLGQGRAAEQAPLGPGVAGADGVGRAVANKAPGLWSWLIGPCQASLQLGPQHKLLKEPGGVAQVPLGRAGVGHPLQAEVLWLQGGHQGQALLAHPYVPRRQLLFHPAAANSG